MLSCDVFASALAGAIGDAREQTARFRHLVEER